MWRDQIEFREIEIEFQNFLEIQIKIRVSFLFAELSS